MKISNSQSPSVTPVSTKSASVKGLRSLVLFEPFSALLFTQNPQFYFMTKY